MEQCKEPAAGQVGLGDGGADAADDQLLEVRQLRDDLASAPARGCSGQLRKLNLAEVALDPGLTDALVNHQELEQHALCPTWIANESCDRVKMVQDLTDEDGRPHLGSRRPQRRSHSTSPGQSVTPRVRSMTPPMQSATSQVRCTDSIDEDTRPHRNGRRPLGCSPRPRR